MARNRWPDKIGMGGRFASESVAGMVRNIHILERQLCSAVLVSHRTNSLEKIMGLHLSYKYKTGLLVCGRNGLCAQGLYQSAISNVARSRGYPLNRSDQELRNAEKVMGYLEKINLFPPLGYEDHCIAESYVKKLDNKTLPYSFDPRR